MQLPSSPSIIFTSRYFIVFRHYIVCHATPLAASFFIYDIIITLSMPMLSLLVSRHYTHSLFFCCLLSRRLLFAAAEYYCLPLYTLLVFTMPLSAFHLLIIYWLAAIAAYRLLLDIDYFVTRHCLATITTPMPPHTTCRRYFILMPPYFSIRISSIMPSSSLPSLSLRLPLLHATSFSIRRHFNIAIYVIYRQYIAVTPPAACSHIGFVVSLVNTIGHFVGYWILLSLFRHHYYWGFTPFNIILMSLGLQVIIGFGFTYCHWHNIVAFVNSLHAAATTD